MTDYIKREDAERMVAGMKSADGLSAVKALGVIPSADVVPVVRCKDCKWWDECDELDENGYCHHGEREGE